MMMPKLRIAAVVTLTFGVSTVGVVALVRRAQAERTPLQAPQAKGEAQGRGSIPFQKIGLNTDDLAESTGLDLYKFSVDLTKGRRFRVVLQVRQDQESPARELVGFPLRATGDEPTTIRVSFLRTDRKLQGFLLSAEPEAEYRVNCSGGATGGFATVIKNPLGDIAPTLRGLVAYQSDARDAREGPKQNRLLAVAAQIPGGRGIDMSGYPRAEVVITED